MKSISNIDEVNKIVRNQLLIQSELPSNFVRNSIDIYGTALDQLLEEVTYVSVTPCDTILLFELKTRESNADVSMLDKDETLLFYKSYTIKIILYGKSSATIANTLSARLRSEQSRNNLQDNGVYVERVSNPVSLNEFKNNVLWLRSDLDIDISCQMSIQQINVEHEFEVTNLYIFQKN